MKITLKKQNDDSIKWEDVRIGNFFVLGTAKRTLAYKYNSEQYIIMAFSSGSSWGDSMMYIGANINIPIVEQFKIDKWEF